MHTPPGCYPPRRPAQHISPGRRPALGWAILLASVLALPTTAWANICDRTPEVEEWILSQTGDTDCAEVTDAALNGLTGTIEISGYSSPILLSSDFAELTGTNGVVIVNSPALKQVPANAFNELDKTKILGVYLKWSGIEVLESGVFDGFTAITDVDLLDNALKALEPNLFAGLPSSVVLISLTSNNLTTLDEDLFAGLSSLKYINLNSNNLTTLPASLFAGLENLEALTLASNNLTTLPAGLFAGLSALAELYLYNNAFTTLPAGLFADLESLDILWLTGNNLTTLPATLFADLENLNILWLNGNTLTTLPATLFAGLSALSELDLGGNALTELPTTLFAGLSALRKLYLDNNAFTALPAGLFAGLENLRLLFLSGNDTLETLPATLFDPLDDSLTDLYLHNNALSSLDAALFAGLTGLQQLYLLGNQLSSLPAALFADLTALQQLYLHNNALSSLDAALFAGLTGLEILSLSGNDLDALDAGLFTGLAALSSLNLDENALSSLPTNVFDPLDDSLTDLYLRDNGLMALPADVFAGLGGLQRLDLSCNALATLDPTVFSPFATTLTYLDLDANDFTTPTAAEIEAVVTGLQDLHLDSSASACHPASDVGLSNLAVSTGTLSPPFEPPGARSSRLRVAHDVETVTIIPMARSPHATWSSSKDVDSTMDGIQLRPIRGISTDLNIVSITVQAENRKDTGKYYVRIVKDDPPASNALLRDLAFSDLELQPGFDILTFDYWASVQSTPASTTVTATPLDPDAAVVIKRNGVKVSGEIPLAGGDEITIEVTAEDGVTTQTYTVTMRMRRTDFTNPVLQRATVSGNTVIMTYNEPLLEDGCPDGEMLNYDEQCPAGIQDPQESQFRLREGGAALSDQEGYPNDVGVSGSTVTLTFDEIDTTNGVELHYTRGIFPIRDRAGNAAAALDWTLLPYSRPADRPGAPTNLRATAGDGQVRLTWTAPADDGGEAIDEYEYEINDSGVWTSTGGTSTSYTVSGLTNDQAYRFRVRAQ